MNLRLLMPVMAIVAKGAKAMKLVKFGAVVITATVSVAAYAWTLHSWLFGVGLVASLLVHEMGHLWVLREQGARFSLPIFIPFVGAMIATDRITIPEDEAAVGIGGPLAGSVLAALLAIGWLITGDDITLVFAYLNAFLNLFNMIALRPFDGGRILAPLGKWVAVLGILLLFGFSLFIAEPWVLFLWVFSLGEVSFLSGIWRLRIGIILDAIMIALVVAGFSDQDPWIDGMDCVVATLFLGLFWMRRDDEPTWRLEESRPRRSGFLWAARYLMLSGALIGLMAYLFPHLPGGGPQ